LVTGAFSATVEEEKVHLTKGKETYLATLFFPVFSRAGAKAGFTIFIAVPGYRFLWKL
jgi:hypothetical protein